MTMTDHPERAFIIKMCDKFEEPTTRMLLSTTMYMEWMPNTDLPSAIVEGVLARLA